MARGKKVVVEPEIIEEVKVPAKESSIYYPVPDYNGYEITVALRSIGVDSSYENRMNIYKANGFENYLGLGAHNKVMLELLKAGKLKKA